MTARALLLGMAAVGSGCVALPAEDPEWAACADAGRLVFARSRAAAAARSQRWGLAVLAAGAAAFAAGFATVVAHTGDADADDVKPAFRVGFALMGGGLLGLAAGGACSGQAASRRAAWAAEAALASARAPP